MMKDHTSPRYREFPFGITRATLTERGSNTYLCAEQALGQYPKRMTDKLVHWAQTTPNRIWMARRGKDGAWVTISYQQAWDKAQRIGQCMLNMGLSAQKPVAILSENSLEHALIALGAMTVGVPYCSVSPAYSTMSQDFEKLRHVVSTITPSLVFASSWGKYGKAIAAVLGNDVTVVISDEANYDNLASAPGKKYLKFSDLLSVNASSAVLEAMEATNSDTIVKFLFTSGSTKLPKAVINTQSMWCANQQQMLQSMPMLGQEPPVLVDWLPWNHTFGGNHNFGMVIYHGGTLYIDDGKPTPDLIEITLRNLREIAPTAYFNVPTGFEQIAAAMETDDILRATLLSRCNFFFYAGAALAQPVWDSLFESQERQIGQRVVMGTGLGMTESGPFGIFVTSSDVKAGDLGLPCAGLELKLVPNGDKTEVRYRGPNITPGYWRNPEATAECLDDEGFFCTGDAVKWIDENDLHKGLKFDGRIAEDFKLSTGTFVSVGPMRSKIITAAAPYIQDAVITGINEKEVGALLILALSACKSALDLPDSATLKDVATNGNLTEILTKIIQAMAKNSTGSASKVARAVVLTEEPSIDKGEITDKGSINQRAVLKERAALVTALHAGTAERILKP